MDWTKAKTIIIVALILTNLLLFGAWMLKAADRAGRDEEETLRAILASGNIFFETDLPRKPGKMAVLYVQPEINDRLAVERALAEHRKAPAANASDAAFVEAADAIIESCGYMNKNVEVSMPPERNNGRVSVSYRDVFDGIPIEEGYIVCTFEDGRVTGLDRKWYTPLELRDRKGDIVTPLRALVQLIGEKDENSDVIIRDMELVYWVNPQGLSEESPVGDTALPAWKITDSLGQTSYISAYE